MNTKLSDEVNNLCCFIDMEHKVIPWFSFDYPGKLICMQNNKCIIRAGFRNAKFMTQKFSFPHNILTKHQNKSQKNAWSVCSVHVVCEF